MAFKPKTEKVLKILIYEASCSLTPLICYLLLKENRSKEFQIRFHFLETNTYKLEAARKHFVSLNNFGSKKLESVVLLRDPKVAFKDVDYAIILPSMLFEGEMDYSKFSDVNLFINIGYALEKYAAKSVNVIIFGPKSVNLLCSICSYFCPSINSSQITGVSYHHELRSKRILGDKIAGNPKRIGNVFVWGTDQVDVINACYKEYEDSSYPETKVEEYTNAVQIIEIKGCQHHEYESKFSSQESEQDVKNKNSTSVSGIAEFLKNESEDFKPDQWKQNCRIRSQGFHCQDIVPVEYQIECYTYELWDIKSPDVMYKTKYFNKSVYKRDSKVKQDESEDFGGKSNLKTVFCPDLSKECKHLSELIQDDVWIKSELIDRVKNLDSMTESKYVSTIVYAIVRHFQHILYGSTHPISMIVNSDGSYNVQRGIYFSFPVRVIDGRVVIVRDICMDSITQRYIDIKSCGLKSFVDKLPFNVSKLDELKENLKTLIMETEKDEELSMSDMENSVHSYASGPIGKMG